MTDKKKPTAQLDVILVHQESFYVVDGYQVNLGLLSIATFLEQQGFSVKILSNNDLYMLRDFFVQRIFTSYRPKLIGFYTMTDNIHHVYHLAKKVKKWSPASKFLAGGPLASALLAQMGQLFPFDYIIKGEGEYSVTALAEYVCHQKGELSEIPGLYYRQEDKYVEGAPSQYITDLDALPDPDRNLVPRTSRLNICSGRGCPNSCTFCFQAVHGKGYRFRSADRVANEVITNLSKYNYPAFDIIDDTFVAEPDRVLRFCELLKEYRKESKRNFIWYCEARVDTLSERPELLQAMKETGLIRLQVGIETGDHATLKRYGKRLDLDKLKALCSLVNSLDGISIFGNFIIGGPYETQETFAKSMELVMDLLHIAPGLFEASSGFLAPYPQTPIGRRPDLFGLTVEDDSYLTSVTPDECYCSTPSLTRPQLRKMRFDFAIETINEMRRMLPNIHRQRLLQHFHWFRHFNTQTRWLTGALSPLGAVSAYFKYYDTPRFAALGEIPPKALIDWTPFRTIQTLQYNTDDWENYHLEGSYEDIDLREPFEKDVYALAIGKLTMGETLAELKRRHMPENNMEEVWNRALPIYQNLERHFQIIFHE